MPVRPRPRTADSVRAEELVREYGGVCHYAQVKDRLAAEGKKVSEALFYQLKRRLYPAAPQVSLSGARAVEVLRRVGPGCTLDQCNRELAGVGDSVCDQTFAKYKKLIYPHDGAEAAPMQTNGTYPGTDTPIPFRGPLPDGRIPPAGGTGTAPPKMNGTTDPADHLDRVGKLARFAAVVEHVGGVDRARKMLDLLEKAEGLL